MYTFLSNTIFNTYTGNGVFTPVSNVAVGNSSVNVAITDSSVSIGSNVVANTSSLIVGVNSVNTISSNFVNYAGATQASNNLTVSVQTGNFYNMNLTSGVQVLNLPTVNAIPDGYNVIVRAQGFPLGHQTAYVSAESGKTISYRNFSNQLFHLIGAGETFRFTWLNGLNFWFAEVLVQPGSVSMYRTQSGASWNSGATSFNPISFNGSGGTTAPFSIGSGSIRLPVTGVWRSNYSIYMSSAAGGGVGGTGYVCSGNKSASGVDTQYSYLYQAMTLNEDSINMQVDWSTFYTAGEYSVGWYLMSSTAIWFYPGNNRGMVELVSR